MADPIPTEAEIKKLRRLVNLMLVEAGYRIACVSCRNDRQPRDVKRAAEIHDLMRETDVYRG